MELFRQWRGRRLVRGWFGDAEAKADEKEEDRGRGENDDGVAESKTVVLKSLASPLNRQNAYLHARLHPRKNKYESYSDGNMRDPFFIWSKNLTHSFNRCVTPSIKNHCLKEQEEKLREGELSKCG